MEDYLIANGLEGAVLRLASGEERAGLDLRGIVEETRLVRQVLASLHTRYDRYIAGKPGPDEVRARVILAPTEEEARALIGKAQGGADFAELARQYSKDPTAAQGGDLGYVVLEAVSPEVGSVMFSMPLGQVTAYPVNSIAGYFVIRVEGRRQRATPAFDEARAVLERAERADAVRLAVSKVVDDIKIVPAKPAGAAPAKK